MYPYVPPSQTSHLSLSLFLTPKNAHPFLNTELFVPFPFISVSLLSSTFSLSPSPLSPSRLEMREVWQQPLFVSDLSPSPASPARSLWLVASVHTGTHGL